MERIVTNRVWFGPKHPPSGEWKFSGIPMKIDDLFGEDPIMSKMFSLDENVCYFEIEGENDEGNRS